MKEIKKVSDLVIGGNLEALEFAYREGFPVFYEKLEVPFHLDQTKEGINRKDIIENYAFILSLAGLNYHSHIVANHRLEQNTLTISGKTPWITEIHFERLHDFRKDSTKIYKVVDYINVRSCGPHELREIKTDEDFVKEIYFYPSQRCNSTKKFDVARNDYITAAKDVMLVSYMRGDEIDKEENSQIYTRLKLKQIMKDLGIKGKRQGKQKSGAIKYCSIKLEFAKREINEIEENNRNYYYSQSKNSYMSKIFNYMYGRST